MFSLNGIDLEPHPRESRGATDSGATGLPFQRTGSLHILNYREPEQRMCQNRSRAGEFVTSEDPVILKDVARLRVDCDVDSLPNSRRVSKSRL